MFPKENGTPNLKLPENKKWDSSIIEILTVSENPQINVERKSRA